MSKLLVKHVLAVTLDNAGSILQNVEIGARSANR